MKLYKLFFLILMMSFLNVASANVWKYLGGNGLGVSHIAVDPHKGSVIYASSDKYMFKSESHGATWVHIGDTLEGEITSITIDPQNVNIVYVTTRNDNRGSIYKTQNGGGSWSKNTNYKDYFVADLIVNPNDNSILYLATGNAFYKSEDDGQNWNIISSVAGTSTTSFAASMVINPQNPDIIYVGTLQTAFNPTIDGVFKSTDQGISWERVTQERSFSQKFDATLPIAINPHNPDIFYIGNEYFSTMLKTIDGGKTWHEVNNGLTELAHNELKTIAIDPHNPEKVYLGTRSGLYHSANGGDKWELISNIVDGEELYIKSIAVDPQQPERLYIGTSNKGLYQLITDNNCMANYDTSSTKLSIPCLSVDNQTPAYEVDLTKLPSDDAFGITRTELR